MCCNTESEQLLCYTELNWTKRHDSSSESLTNHNQNFFELPSLSFVRFSSAYNKEVTSKSNLDACLATLLQHAQWIWSNDVRLWLLKDQLEQCRISKSWMIEPKVSISTGTWNEIKSNFVTIESIFLHQVGLLDHVGFMNYQPKCDTNWVDLSWWLSRYWLCQVSFMDDGVKCGAIWADFHHNQVNSSQFWRSTQQNSSINSFETSSLEFSELPRSQALPPTLARRAWDKTSELYLQIWRRFVLLCFEPSWMVNPNYIHWGTIQSGWSSISTSTGKQHYVNSHLSCPCCTFRSASDVLMVGRAQLC